MNHPVYVAVTVDPCFGYEPFFVLFMQFNLPTSQVAINETSSLCCSNNLFETMQRAAMDILFRKGDLTKSYRIMAEC